MKKLLEMKSITKTFPGVRALDGVDFDITSHEIHVVVGENGAGKSTLLKTITGAHQPDSGEIYIEGKKIQLSSPAIALSLGIAAVYQQLSLVPSFSVLENIALGNEPGRVLIDKVKQRERVEELLDSYGIKDGVDLDSRVEDLPMSEKQLVEICKALRYDPKIILMDEPTRGLQYEEIIQLFIYLRKLREQGVGIVYISHRLEEVLDIGDKVTVLRDGKVVAVKTVVQTNHEDLVKLIAGRTIKEQYPMRNNIIKKPLITIDDLTSAEGYFSKVSFEIKEGEIVGLTGVLGSGCEKVGRALFGDHKIINGRIILGGQCINLKSPSDAIDVRIGLVTRDRLKDGLVNFMNISDNIVLPSLRRYVDRILIKHLEVKKDIMDLVKKLNIRSPGIEYPTEYLSGGNQQKTVLAKWLLAQGKFLVLDEPTAGVDVGSRAEIHHHINDLTKQGLAILLISIEIEEILGLSDRVLVMQNGRIIAERNSKETSKEEILFLSTKKEVMAK
ncbi:Galactose/methyl galactoside import ATP-binding protein MglA [subsurface metagenome]